MELRSRLFPLLAALGTIASCEGDADDGTVTLPECIDFGAAACAPLYEPTYPNVFAQTFTPKCATGGACHENEESMGAAAHGLNFADADAAYSLLLEDLGEATFVRAGDASCGILTVRLRTDDDALRMPSGSMLGDTEICSVLRWIDAGAMP